MDATRISDGARVVLKSLTVTSHPEEIDIHRYLTSPERLSDPKNHCTPLYEVVPNPSSSERAFIAMPLLLPYDFVPFSTVGEVLDCVGQVFEVSPLFTVCQDH
jgi:hypothetical protein